MQCDAGLGACLKALKAAARDCCVQNASAFCLRILLLALSLRHQKRNSLSCNIHIKVLSPLTCIHAKITELLATFPLASAVTITAKKKRVNK